MPSLGFKAITPKHIPSTKEYLDAVRKGVQKTAKLVERDLESTTRTWKHKPKFYTGVSEAGGDYAITAGTDDLRYKWINDGTKPHIIRPRRAPFLRFRVGGSPKTQPGIIGSGPGSQGDQWRTAQFVQHPGITKRDFMRKIQERRQKTAEQEISQNIAKVNRTQA